MKTDSARKEMSSSQRAYLWACGFFLLAVLIYQFGVRTTEDAVRSRQKELNELLEQQTKVQCDLRDSHPAREKRVALEKAREPYLNALLTPLLGSWSMRAKAVLDPLAADVGLKLSDYTELPARALPLPKPTPLQLYARQPIRVVCRGSYAAIASFVLRVEKLLPYVSLQAMSIKTQKDPAVQYATLVFEWPSKGALSRAVPAAASASAPAKGGAK